MSVRMSSILRRAAAFTLTELVIVIAIIAVLAAMAIPQYLDHLRRARLTEAITRLADHRVRMEQFFLDNRRYDDDAGRCGYPAPAPSPADTFAIECFAAANAYSVTATGIGGMQGFVYTIDQANAHRTPAVPPGWLASDTCWVVRRDGSCG